MKTAVIVNPAAGKKFGAAVIDRCLAVLRESGLVASAGVHWTGAPGEGRALAEKLCRDGCELIIAAGGDGTVSEVAAPLAGTDTVFAFIPAGTVNVFALELGLPADPVAVCRRIAERHVRKLDTITFVYNEREYRAVLWVGLGGDALIIRKTSLRIKKYLGRLAYAAAAVAAGCDRRGVGIMEVTVSGIAARQDASQVIISNSCYYAGQYRLARDARPDDGLLHLTLIRGGGMGRLLGHAIKLLAGRLTPGPDLQQHAAAALQLELTRPAYLHVDGDLFSPEPVTGPLTFTVEPGALNVFA